MGKRGVSAPGKNLLVNAPAAKFDRVHANLAAIAEANKNRTGCAICGNLVLPEKMGQHVRVYHP